jgi:class 3 adenylate cyclase
MALMSFVLILAGIHKSKLCDSYRDNPELNKRMPNYRVSLGFGLHIGWAIEGAIGSTFKIDASYLSPNVNMSNILEAATKEYGTPILFTGDLANHFSDKLKT